MTKIDYDAQLRQIALYHVECILRAIRINHLGAAMRHIEYLGRLSAIDAVKKERELFWSIPVITFPDEEDNEHIRGQ